MAAGATGSRYRFGLQARLKRFARSPSTFVSAVTQAGPLATAPKSSDCPIRYRYHLEQH
jgi:hypothetical protein